MDDYLDPVPEYRLPEDSYSVYDRAQDHYARDLRREKYKQARQRLREADVMAKTLEQIQSLPETES